MKSIFEVIQKTNKKKILNALSAKAYHIIKTVKSIEYGILPCNVASHSYKEIQINQVIVDMTKYFNAINNLEIETRYFGEISYNEILELRQTRDYLHKIRGLI